jgi:hypothetical protein
MGESGAWPVWHFSGLYSDYRYESFPSEQANPARTFRIQEWERVSFRIRAEFFNVFNRTVLPNPTATNPLAAVTYTGQGLLSGGFGYINSNSVSGQRNGQLKPTL